MSDSGTPVTTVQRIDAAPSRLGKFSRTGAGAVRVPATISRTGIQIYGNRTEYRPDSEVFHEDSLASLAGIPVTFGHPPVSVTPANAKTYSVGHMSDAPPEARVKLDGDDNEWLRAVVYVADGAIQARAERGDSLKVSAGYTCELDPTPGVAPCGTRYDAVQRNIRFNHVAVLDGQTETPRAGAHAQLRLDSQGNPMVMIKIDGVELEKGSDAHIAAIQAGANRQVAEMQAKLDAVEGARTLAVKEATDAKAAAAQDKLDALVAEQIKLRTDAAKFLPADYKFEGKSAAAVRIDAVTGKLGAEAVAGKSADFINGVFTAMLAAPPAAPVKAEYVKPDVKADSVEPRTDAEIEAAHVARMRKVYTDSLGKDVL
jgi:hypothetical protein